MPAVPIFVADAFTDRPFHGNPAAVCFLPGPRPDRWLQDVAAEMNLAETAFLLPEADGFRLRWLTPVAEVDLCGHATLASAHILWQEGRAQPDSPIRFHTRSGVLTAAPRRDGIALDFPATPPAAAEPPAGLVEALGLSPRFVGRTQFNYLIECDTAAVVRQARPDFRRLRDVEVGARGIIITARSDDPAFNFVSRFFAPRLGVDEDPVTGSAHCSLGPFWAERLGRTALVGYQASARGGVVRVEVGGERVQLIGQAVTVWRGALEV
jgi:PhzF family phenazine biosynthesis protein